MIYLSVNAETGEIYGRVREETPTSIEVDSELFGRYLGDPSAFIYYPDRKTIDVRPDYEAPKLLSLPTDVLENYQTRLQEEIYVPELNVHVNISGAFGRAFLAALTLAPYKPQKVLVYDNGAYSVIEIDLSNLPFFAEAYSKHFADILEAHDE
ncbi:tail fiber protein [Dickeya phage vB_DsoM_JA29]|uniref:Uncharacterized protein n=1 Tax=Dickeya phage vB_DsoM_JA29 TaxID=2283031 RepID=A0A384ZX39_9CAUD|nr:tail fiber protein [Dickeya phage vB_DsoM_JA29]AXG66818.1 hypothetical protein JA29_092 [Dickeya phage vB_DsoM_JA29]